MCLACEPIGSRHGLHLCPRHLHIDASVHRVLLDGAHASRRAWQAGQRARQIGVEIGLPQAHQPREPLACRRGLLLGADKLCVHLGGEHLAARLIEPVHRAGALELVRELSRSRGASLGLAEGRNDLPAGDRAHISAPRLGRDPQGLLRGAEFGGCEFIRSDPGARRHGEQRQQAADDLPLDVEFDRCRHVGEVEGQRRWPARLDGERLGDTEPVIGGLKPEIVEERDLHCRIGAERAAQ